MEATISLLDGCASICSQCWMCTKRKQLRIGVLMISFILGTVDMVTDWINYIQWSSVGGYDQHYFIFIFQTAFLCTAVVGTILWTIEVILMTRVSWRFIKRCRNWSRVEPIGNEDHIQDPERSLFSERLGFIIRLLIGLLEDLPVVLLLYYAVTIPICGVPAKRESSSPTFIATVVSSMLNSMWTMFMLYWELCGCTKKLSNAECCWAVIRSIYEPHILLSICYCGYCGCATSSNCRCICLRQNHANPPSNNSGPEPSFKCGKRVKKLALHIGRTLLCGIIFVIFISIFILSAMTISIVYKDPVLEQSIVRVGPSSKSIKADKIGPGLDSTTDAAMFVTMVYQLPNWYHVGLYDNRNVNIANSASVYQIQNRLYIGQFNELEYLKDGTLTKAIPCARIFPFLEQINETFFQWNNSQKLNLSDFSNCKLIFRLRYYPSDNNWNPFINFVHKFVKDITVEWGIYIKDNETCPSGFQPLPVSSLLTDTVKQDIVNYTCSLACINATDVCREASYGKFEESQIRRSSSGLASRPQFYLTINDQQFTDFCFFGTFFIHTMKFCDISWADMQQVQVPDFVEQLYPQFITMPMTYKESGDNPHVFLDSKCSKLWVEGEKISF